MVVDLQTHERHVVAGVLERQVQAHKAAGAGQLPPGHHHRPGAAQRTVDAKLAALHLGEHLAGPFFPPRLGQTPAVEVVLDLLQVVVGVHALDQVLGEHPLGVPQPPVGQLRQDVPGFVEALLLVGHDGQADLTEVALVPAGLEGITGTAVVASLEVEPALDLPVEDGGLEGAVEGLGLLGHEPVDVPDRIAEGAGVGVPAVDLLVGEGQLGEGLLEVVALHQRLLQRLHCTVQVAVQPALAAQQVQHVGMAGVGLQGCLQGLHGGGLLAIDVLQGEALAGQGQVAQPRVLFGNGVEAVPGRHHLALAQLADGNAERRV